MTSTPRRVLGPGHTTALIVASMIGAGVFTTSGLLLRDLGSPGWVLLAWAVGGLQAMLGAICYGALARRIPESGGEYLFLSRTLHPAAGYLAGLISLVVGFSAPLAAAAFAFGEYSRPWFPGMNPQASGTVLICGFAFLHALHVQSGARVQTGVVALKLALIAAFICFGVSHRPEFPAAPHPEAPPSWPAFGAALVWVSFSYSGWNAAVYLGSEVRKPETTLPQSMGVATFLVTALYVALNAVFVYSAPLPELTGQLQVGRIAARALGGPALGEACAALVALALVTSVSSLLMAGPRVYARMAHEGLLPRFLETPGSGPPRAAILFQAALALLLLWTSRFEQLLTYIGFTLGLSTAATVLGLMLLRRREGASLRVPGWPWVPTLFLAAVGAITAFTMFQRPRESLIVVAALGLGGLSWPLLARRNPPGARGEQCS
jgi:amino acid transporter